MPLIFLHSAFPFFFGSFTPYHVAKSVSLLNGESSIWQKGSTVGPLYSSKASKRGKPHNDNNPDSPNDKASAGKGFGHSIPSSYHNADTSATNLDKTEHVKHGNRHEVNQMIHEQLDPTDKHHSPDNFFKAPKLNIPTGFVPTSLHRQSEEGHDAKEMYTFHHNQNPVAAALSHIISSAGRPQLVSQTMEWKRLQQHADYIKSTHLRELLKDPERCDAMYASDNGVYLDYARQRATLKTMDLLLDLAKKQNLKGKIDAMVSGEKINFTEDRAVLHTALRARREQIGSVFVDDLDAVKEVHEVLDQVKFFTDAVRSGEIRGYTGKRLRNIVSVGIGGSYLGPEFLHEVLKTEPEGINSALGYSLRFLSNVDPVDVERTCADLDPEETLIVIVSKTFTTAETMLNARTMRQWLWDFMGDDADVVRKHVVACASISATDQVEAFGIDTLNYFFRFWDWIGGRYSVCSAAGAVPISLLYGYDLFEKFLEVSNFLLFFSTNSHKTNLTFSFIFHGSVMICDFWQGANSIDQHFLSAPFESNIPVIMGLLGVWNMSFLDYNTRTTLPYAEALLKLPAHIQQLDMEV